MGILATKFSNCSVLNALVILTVIMIMFSFQAVATKSNPNDISPEFAGVINALANTVANTSGFWAPFISGVIFDNYGQSSKSWAIVFFTTTAVALLTGLIYFIFHTTEEVEWSKKRKNKSEIKDSKFDEVLTTTTTT